MTYSANNNVKTITEITNDSKAMSSLAAAFATDPVFQFCFGANDKTKKGNKTIDYSARLRPFFNACGKFALLKNCTIHTSFDEECAAIWSEDESWKEKDNTALPMLFTMFKCFRGGTFNFLRVQNNIDKYHPKEPHVYLWMIGTAPEGQGKGLGSQVISKMLEQCDREGLAAYLESSNEKNIPFYKRHGFEIMQVIPNCPKNCPPITTMWRKPRTTA